MTPEQVLQNSATPFKEMMVEYELEYKDVANAIGISTQAFKSILSTYPLKPKHIFQLKHGIADAIKAKSGTSVATALKIHENEINRLKRMFTMLDMERTRDLNALELRKEELLGMLDEEEQHIREFYSQKSEAIRVRLNEIQADITQ